jgi:hypothetical protein
MLPTVNRNASTKPYSPDYRSIGVYQPWHWLTVALAGSEFCFLNWPLALHGSFGFKHLILRQLRAVNGIHVGIVQRRRETDSLQGLEPSPMPYFVSPCGFKVTQRSSVPVGRRFVVLTFHSLSITPHRSSKPGSTLLH